MFKKNFVCLVLRLCCCVCAYSYCFLLSPIDYRAELLTGQGSPALPCTLSCPAPCPALNRSRMKFWFFTLSCSGQGSVHGRTGQGRANCFHPANLNIMCWTFHFEKSLLLIFFQFEMTVMNLSSGYYLIYFFSFLMILIFFPWLNYKLLLW
jgi:hypothetical protein